MLFTTTTMCMLYTHSTNTYTTYGAAHSATGNDHTQLRVHTCIYIQNIYVRYLCMRVKVMLFYYHVNQTCEFVDIKQFPNRGTMYEFNITMMQAFTVQYIIYEHMLYIILLSTGHGISYVITLSVSEFMNGLIPPLETHVNSIF